MIQQTPATKFVNIIQKNKPAAYARITGNEKYPYLSGLVKFFNTPYQCAVVEAEIFGLPDSSGQNISNFYAMHIHQFGDCSGDFSKTGEHFNPTGARHPYHAGDLLPLISSQGYAWSAFYDSRFKVADIIGKSVIIHAGHDDFTTQPSGNAGEKIGCGVIQETE